MAKKISFRNYLRNQIENELRKRIRVSHLQDYLDEYNRNKILLYASVIGKLEKFDSILEIEEKNELNTFLEMYKDVDYNISPISLESVPEKYRSIIEAYFFHIDKVYGNKKEKEHLCTEIQRMLQEQNITNYQLSKSTGIGMSQIYKLKNGNFNALSLEKIKYLYAYLISNNQFNCTF